MAAATLAVPAGHVAQELGQLAEGAAATSTRSAALARPWSSRGRARVLPLDRG